MRTRRLDRADQADDAQRGAALERHDRQPDDARDRASASAARPSAHAVLHEDEVGDARPGGARSTLPASDASAPFGIRIVSDGVCSNESGIESRRTLHAVTLRASESPASGVRSPRAVPSSLVRLSADRRSLPRATRSSPSAGAASCPRGTSSCLAAPRRSAGPCPVASVTRETSVCSPGVAPFHV